MAYQMPGPATAAGSSNARPTIYPALVSATASYPPPPRQGSKRSYDEYGAQDGIPNTSFNHHSRAGSASAMNYSQEHPSKRFRGDEPLVTHRSHPSDPSSGLTNRQTPSRAHNTGHSHPSFPDVSGSSLYLMPEPQPYTTFHLTDPVVLPPFPEPHQAIPQTHWQYPSVEPRTAPSQQVSVSRAAPPSQVEPRRPPNSSADAYAWDLAPMDWFSSSTNDSSILHEGSRQAPPHPDQSTLHRHSEHTSALQSLPSHFSSRDVGSNPPPAHANHARLSESLPEPGHQLPPTFLPVNASFEDTAIPYSLPSSSTAPAPPIFDQPMPAPSTRAPQSRMNPSREPPSVVHHSTHDNHDLGPSASHRTMSYPRRLNPYNFLQPTASSPSRSRPDLPSSRRPLLPPSSTSGSRSNSRHDIPRLNEASHQIDHWIERPPPEPSNTPPFDMPVAPSPLHVVSPPITTTTTTTTTSTTTRRMSTRAAQRVQERVQEWRQEVPAPSPSTGPSTGTRAHQHNESLWDSLFVPSQEPPSPPHVAPPVPERRNRRRTRTSELFDITPFPIHPSPSLDLDDHDMLSFFVEEGDLLPYDPMVMPLPTVEGTRPRRPRRRNTNTNTGVNGSGNRNADVNISDDADPMWSNMATLHRLRRATAGAGDATFGENTSGAIANQRDRITALMRATFGRRTMRLGRTTSMGDFVHDDDFDDSYEGLMRLSAMIGDVRKGVSSDVLDKLPKGKFSEFVDTRGKGKDKEREGDLACAICLEEYKDDDDCVKMIRCRHFYHAECIRQWLQNASTCPICREGVEEEQLQPFGSPPGMLVEPTEIPFTGASSRNHRGRQGSVRDASGSSSNSSLNTVSGLAAQWTRAQPHPNENAIDWATRLIDTIPGFDSIHTGAVNPSPEIFGTVRRRSDAPRLDDWLFDDFIPPAPALGPISVYDEDPDILFRPVIPERSTRRTPANMRVVEPIRMAPSPQPVLDRVVIPPPLPPMEQEENHSSRFASWVAVNSRPQQVPPFMPPPPPPPRHAHPQHPHLHNGSSQAHPPNAHNLSVVGSSLLASATAAAGPHISRDGQNQHRRYDPPQYPPPTTSHPAQGSSSSRWGRLPGLPTFGLGSGSRNGGSSGHGRPSSTGSQRLGSSLHVRRQSSPAPISRSINLDLSDS